MHKKTSLPETKLQPKRLLPAGSFPILDERGADASVMFSETTEVRDGIDQLTARAATPEVAQAMIRDKFNSPTWGSSSPYRE